jgi:hypothetical protein
MNRTISIKPDGPETENYRVLCPCGYVDKTRPWPTQAAKRREATQRAVEHNARQHASKYHIHMEV